MSIISVRKSCIRKKCSLNENEKYSLLNQNCTLIVECFASGAVSFLVLWVLFAYKGYAPFGNSSLACMDANIQYLDFFAWLKNVLSGNDNIAYTFTKVLGGTAVGIYSYYLASPFSFLVGLFDQSQLHSFFDLVVSLKLVTAAVFCAVFLHFRFRENKNLDSVWHVMMTTMLSVSFALGQYSIAQASNIPWLDGVYMLPLILLGVFRLVWLNRKVLLSISVACSILFNWYTGGINCLFAIFWFLFEIVLIMAEDRLEMAAAIKSFFFKLCHFGFCMVIGVLLSGVLFLPTIGAMQKSTRGNLDLYLLKDIRFLGNILSGIEAYVPGRASSLGVVSLYSGSLALIGCAGFFFCRSVQRTKKMIYAGLFAFMLFMFYWNPLYVLFSLLKEVGSYWYRYSYIGIFVLVFIAGGFFLLQKAEDIKNSIIPASACYILLLLILNDRKDGSDLNIAYRSAAFVVICAILILLSVDRLSKENHIHRSRTIFYCVSMGLLFLLESFYSVSKQMDNYHTGDVDKYKDYVIKEQSQIAEIKNDQGIYRISQTSSRFAYDTGLTSYYQDAMAYHYWSIAGYSSSPDTNQLQFLDRMGYRQNGETYCIVNTSVLGADSLLGVKYVMSKFPVNGLILRDDISEINGKQVYENPYALPFAFVYEKDPETGAIENDMNPFEYQNAVYRLLSGTDHAEIYFPLKYEASNREDGSLMYEVEIPSGHYSVYGNLPWDVKYKGTVDVNGAYQTGYAMWASPSVFYIPSDQNRKEEGDVFQNNQCTITVMADQNLSSNGKEQFYALDLDRFKEVTDILKRKECSEAKVENGHVLVRAEGIGKNSHLFLSIPDDDSWDIMCNGKHIEPELIGDCLLSIPLSEGNNAIEMIYHVKFLNAGIVSTLIGFFLLILYNCLTKMTDRKE